jgi:hypothetical protein
LRVTLFGIPYDEYDLTLWSLSAVVAAVVIVLMWRASGRGALGWKRATAVILCASLAIVVGSGMAVYASGDWQVGPHSAETPLSFLVWVIIRLVVPFPAWIMVGTAAAAILSLRSARIARMAKSA